MTGFAHPWCLGLLVVVAALPWQARLTGAAQLVVPGPGVLRAGWTIRRTLAALPTVLQMLGLALLVVALARPQRVHKEVKVTSDGLDILLALDTSQSMSEADFSIGGRAVDRLSVAKGVMAEFVNARPYDRIGLVLFGEEAFTHVPLTLDHETLNAVLDDVQLGVAGGSATAVGTAIAVATKRISALDAPSRVVILVTDGRSNAGALSPDEAAEAAAALGVKLYTIGVGADGGASLLGRLFGGGGSGIDEVGLTRVAEATGGKYFRAKDTRSLQSIYETIDTLEPSTAEVEELSHREELYPWPLAPGLVLITIAGALAQTTLRRSP
jgi:Ca-activated chloride channel family protein